MSGDDYTVGDTRETLRWQLSDERGSVTVRKLVSKGERLEIEGGDGSVKLDALLLEGLSWQSDREAVDELLDGGTAVATDPAATATEASPGTGATEVDPSDGVSISSEYSHVLVRKVSTPDGAALEITTPNRGSTITLGVQSLVALASVEDTYVFSPWFETPFGPEDTPVEGPL